MGLFLLTQVENWARDHQLERIGMDVWALKTAKIELYEKFAYKVESLHMIKNLD